MSLLVTQDIPLGDPGRGVFAARVGDKLDEATVAENGWEDYVESPPKTKPARPATAAASSE